MKMIIACVGVMAAWPAVAQSVVGTWQQTDRKTCFQNQMKESDTEKELESMMGSHAQSTVAKLIVFKKDGSGQEGIFEAGKKKGNDKNDFQYKVQGQELQLTDKKSGIIIQRFIIDELTENSLKIHDAVKDCETRTFVRAK
ncbi:MAG: hypothetical protein JSS93_15095 [Bacteroidetes bacterium]|nr:hypothetical protein [Bacteroidota bacterium]